LKKLAEEYKPELILSIHSFTPLYEQKKREVEIGVLFKRHEKPAQEVNHFLRFKLVDKKILVQLTKFFKSCGHDARVNDPWSGLDGFMHAASTLEETDTSKGNDCSSVC
jgi:predicted N-formylglutamate amidohydrolase